MYSEQAARYSALVARDLVRRHLVSSLRFLRLRLSAVESNQGTCFLIEIVLDFSGACLSRMEEKVL